MTNDFYHVVHFWLKADLSESDRDFFEVEARKIGNSEHVASFRLGKPAGTPREVVDNSYDFQLLVRFASKEEHDAYQSPDDSVHEAFIANCKHLWSKVLIFDSLEA